LGDGFEALANPIWKNQTRVGKYHVLFEARP
jgi:hypothetical protein